MLQHPHAQQLIVPWQETVPMLAYADQHSTARLPSGARLSTSLVAFNVIWERLTDLLGRGSGAVLKDDAENHQKLSS